MKTLHLTPSGSGGNTAPAGSAAVPGARFVLGLLLAINLLNYVDRYVLSAVVTNIQDTFFPKNGGGDPLLRTVLDWTQQHLGFAAENALTGTLATAFLVAYMITAPVFGRQAEHRSRWLLVSVGVLLWSLASGATGLAATFFLLLLTRCFVGVGEAAYGPVAPTMIADLYPVERRGQVLSWFYLAIPVGIALGYVFGGMMARLYPEKGWRWAFYAVTLPGLLLAVVCRFQKEPPRGRSDPGASMGGGRSLWSDYRVLLRTPSFVYNTLGMSAMTFAMGGIGFWIVNYVQKWRHVSGPIAEIFGSILVVAGLLATLLGGLAGDRLRGRHPGAYFLVSAAGMLLGFPMFVAVLYVPFPAAWVFMFLAIFCLFFNTGPTNTILANVTHPAMRASGFALNIFVIHTLGDVISPVIIGLLTDRFESMNAAFLLVAFMFLVSAGFWLVGARHLARDTELAPRRISG